MKQRFLSTLLALCMALSLLPGTAWAEDQLTGKCGNNVTWALTESGTLTISGTGKMYDYDIYYWKSPPWYKYVDIIKKVVINRGVNSIGEDAFSDCSNLTSVTIPNTVAVIGGAAFSDCDSLTSITIPSNVNTIGGSAFSGCDKLSKVTISNGVTTLGNVVFSNCPSLRSIVLPSSITRMGTSTFVNDKNLTNVTLPANIKSIPWGTFQGCTSLRNVKIPAGVTQIGGDAFKGCTNLTTVILPSGLTALTSAFTGCTSLTHMVIPSGVTSISDHVFYQCTNIKYVTIPASVTSIGRYAFDSCGLTDIYYENGPLTWRSLVDNNVPSSINVHYNSTGPAPAEEKYTVFFDTNGGTMTADDSKTVTKGGTYGTLPTPKRTGYTFKGWYTKSSGGSRVSSGTKVNLTGDQTLYAQWTKSGSTSTTKYTIKFNANGGTVSKTSITVAKNAAYGTLPTPTRSGYSFKGWYTAKTGGTKVSSTTKATASCTLYAQWTKSTGKTYTITLNANGGRVSPSSVKVSGTYGELPVPTRDGYMFDGWYTQRTGGTEITESTKATVNRTIYAHWTEEEEPTPAELTVFFDANGGEVSPEEMVVAAGEPYGDLPVPVLSGYTFQGWYTRETGGTKITASMTVTQDEDHVLYAHWTKAAVKTYTITFNANGGQVSPTSKKVAQNESYGSLPVPTRDGYLFDGWYTSRTGGTEVTEDTRATADRTVYAHWTEEEPDVPDIPEESPEVYTVTFNPNGGRVHQRAKMVVSGGTYQALPIPYQNNYHFAGWYTAKSGGVRITDKTDVNLTGNQTLYAHWTKSAVYVESMESGNWQIRFPSNFHFPVYNSETAAEMHSNVYHGMYATFNCSRRAKLSNGTVRYYAPFGDTERWFTYTCEMDMD